MLSREYEVRIDFARDDTPKVSILSPNIEALAGGRDLPHIYHDPVRLCLYLPGSNEWNSGKRVDQTFVPWTAQWLFYFEEWLASNEWKGGGEHPSPTDHEKYNRHARRTVRDRRSSGAAPQINAA